MIELKNKFGKKYYEAFFDQKNGWVNTKWIGFVPTDEAIKGVEATLNLIQESGCHKLLSDNSQIKGAWSEANDWMEENWFKPARNSGLNKHATILSHDVFSKVSQENFEKSKNGTDIEMKTFDEEVAAVKWLKENY